MDGFAEKSLSEYMAFLFQDVETGGGVKGGLHRQTRAEYLEMWMKNFAVNLPKIRSSDLTLRNLKAEPHDGYAVVVGRGPSMYRKGHLGIIEKSDAYKNGKLKIIACDGALKDCLKNGVVPDYVTGVDGSEVCKKWFKGLRRDDKYQLSLKGTKAVVSCELHPKTVRALEATGMPIYWFLPAHDNIVSLTSITRCLGLMTKWEGNPDGIVVQDCGGNVGSMSWVLSWAVLGFKNVCLVGMDCGYPTGMPKDDTYYWGNILKSIDPVTASTLYEDFTNPFTGERYYLDIVFSHYRDVFLEFVIKKPDWQRTFNASSGTLFRPPYIKACDLEDYLKEVK